MLLEQKPAAMSSIGDLRKIYFEKDILVFGIHDLWKIPTKKFYAGKSKFPSYYDNTICLLKTLKSHKGSSEDIKGNLTW